MKKQILSTLLFLVSFLIQAQIFYPFDGYNDGTLNSVGTGANGTIYTNAIQSDGKIIIGGNFTTFNGAVKNYLTRLNTDGSLDVLFNFLGTGVNGIVRTVSIQSDGKIIIGGDFTSFNGISRNRIARLNPDGTLDATFIVGTGSSSIVYATAIQPDGKVIIGGDFSSYNGTSTSGIARLNTNGSLDGSFNIGTGMNAGGVIRAIVVQTDGKIFCGGGFISFNGVSRGCIVRLNSNGSLDTSLVQATAGGPVLTVGVQSNGRIIIAGNFSAYYGIPRKGIARLNPDGTLDDSFVVGSGTGPSSGIVLTSHIQSNGKIIIGGSFTMYNGTSAGCIARLNTDGTIDNSFITGTGANNLIHTMAVNSQERIVIAGGFTMYNGIVRNGIARIYNHEGIKEGVDFQHPISIGNFSAGSNYSNTQNNKPANGFMNDYGQPSDDIFYAFTLSSPSWVTVDHCGSGISDSYLYLFNHNQILLNSNDDDGPTCVGTKSSMYVNLAAGDYYIASEGYSANVGDITTHVIRNFDCNGSGAGSKIQEAISIPIETIGNTCFTDIKNNGACYNNLLGQVSQEIYYKVVLTSTTNLNIHTSGSEITDTYLWLLDSNGLEITHNDDNGPWDSSEKASLSNTLNAGTYYIAVEGYSSMTGYITLTVWNGSVVNNGCAPASQAMSRMKGLQDKLGKKETDNFDNISLYPNPTNNQVFLIVPNLEETIIVKILNMDGRTLTTIPTSFNKTEINVSDFASGVYYLTFQLKGKIINKKFLVTK